MFWVLNEPSNDGAPLVAAALALSPSADLFRDDIADKSSRVCRNIQTSQSHVKSTIQFIPAWKAEISTKRLRDSFWRYFRVFACCANVAGKDSFENFQNISDFERFEHSEWYWKIFWHFWQLQRLKTNLHAIRGCKVTEDGPRQTQSRRGSGRRERYEIHAILLLNLNRVRNFALAKILNYFYPQFLLGGRIASRHLALRTRLGPYPNDRAMQVGSEINKFC